MSEPQINIRTDAPAGSALQARKRRRSAGPWIVIGSAGLCALAAVVIFAMAASAPSGGASKKSPPAPTSLPASKRQSPAAGVSELAASDGGELVVDDPKGELLWASPTAGEPIDLAYVPAGTQCLIHLRPEDLLATFEGERIFQSLGPWRERAFGRLRPMLGTVMPNIDTLLIAVVVNSDGTLDACLRADLHTPMTEEDLVKRVSGGKENVKEQGYLRIGDRAYILPMGPHVKPGWLVVCPANLAPELIETGGEAPALVRDIERLAEHTDAARIVTVIVAPQFLLASGNELLTAEAQALHQVLEWLVGREATALLLSAHWEENFFIELRATPTLNVTARRLAAKLHSQIAAAPNLVEDLVLSQRWPEYGRKVLARFPAMIRTLARYSRAGEDDRQAVVRAYLPAVAGHNLVMGSELLLTQSSAKDPVTAQPAAVEASPQTLDERLAKKTSLVFSKETLERAIELLAEDGGVEIVIQGADLQLEGITKNQSLAIDLRDRPLQEILVEVLRRANPDRTATGPKDPRQKLVYTVQPGAGDVPGRIIVTTRAAAERRGDRLPDVFLVTER